MIIAPTLDEVARAGSHSSISDEKNNVHWLRATTETAFTFDVLVDGLLVHRRWGQDFGIQAEEDGESVDLR